MDEADKASVLEELWRDNAIAHRHKHIRLLVATGFCHNCREPLNNTTQRFCDADCRDDWEKRETKRT